jgi:hypothetical protein
LPKPPSLRRAPECGGVLVVAMLAMGVLALVATAALFQAGQRHAVTYHSQSWNDAMASAELGADMAMNALNDSLASPGTAWASWTPGDATTFPKTWTPVLPGHAGDGNNKVFATVTVDDAIAGPHGQKWYRVRSTGVAEVAAAARAGIESAVVATDGSKNHRSVLRKTRLSGDLTGGALRLPQIARRIEVMAGAVSTRLLTRGLAVQNAITMSGGAWTDSFDSSDVNKSTGGQYDPGKAQTHGDIASNSLGNLSDLNDSLVLGNAYCNGGTLQGSGGVGGSLFDNFSTTIPPVATPSWGTLNVTPDKVENPPGGMTLVGGPAGAPQNYKLTKLSVSDSANPLILAPHSVGQQSYVNIWVTGKTTISGSGYVQQLSGVHVELYSEDDISIGGGGIQNQTYRAENLKVFGVSPTSGSRTATISAAVDFIGVFNAPAFDLTISGSYAFIGAAVSRNATIIGGGGYHYDEALGDVPIGSPVRYEVSSWIEDVR